MSGAHMLTIVIPVHNRRNLVEHTLGSLRQQTAPRFATVLVDNASTDGSIEVLRKWQAENNSPERPVTVLSESTPGACAARNRGLDAVESPWVLFFDSDDLMHPGHIERVLNGIESHPEADILGWDTIHRNISGKRSIHRFYADNAHWHSLFDGGYATQRWCARTDTVRNAGMWNPQVRLWDDIELGVRMVAGGAKAVKLNGRATVTTVEQAASISANINGDYIERMELPLRLISRSLPPQAHLWTDCVRAINLGNTARGADTGISSLCRQRLGQICSGKTMRERAILRFLYHFRRLGGRGQNIFLRTILNA